MKTFKQIFTFYSVADRCGKTMSFFSTVQDLPHALWRRAVHTAAHSTVSIFSNFYGFYLTQSRTLDQLDLSQHHVTDKWVTDDLAERLDNSQFS